MKTVYVSEARNRRQILKEKQETVGSKAGAKEEGVRSWSQMKKLFSRPLGKHKQSTSSWEIPVQCKNRLSLKHAVVGSVLNMLYMVTHMLSFHAHIPLT
jgi:hypothetical protein